MSLSSRYPDVPKYEEMPSLLSSPTDSFWSDMAKGLYYTGARESELIRVRSRNITESEDNENVLVVDLPTAKNPNQARRIIPIPISEALGYDLFLARASKAIKPQDLAFPPYKYSITVGTFLRRLRLEINKNYGFSPHFLRHCRLTHMVTHYRYNSFQLIQYAGWSGLAPATTYVHLNPLDLIAKMEEIQSEYIKKNKEKEGAPNVSA